MKCVQYSISFLTELLRCFAESTLVDMVQLLFSRLPSLTEECNSVDDTSSMDQVRDEKKREKKIYSFSPTLML